MDFSRLFYFTYQTMYHLYVLAYNGLCWDFILCCQNIREYYCWYHSVLNILFAGAKIVQCSNVLWNWNSSLVPSKQHLAFNFNI
jgi:hypothetical protein